MYSGRGALPFFFFAATKGHIGAAVNLANSYAAADADGVTRSLSKALEWFKYVASKNHQGSYFIALYICITCNNVFIVVEYVYTHFAVLMSKQKPFYLMYLQYLLSICLMSDAMMMMMRMMMMMMYPFISSNLGNKLPLVELYMDVDVDIKKESLNSHSPYPRRSKY